MAISLPLSQVRDRFSSTGRVLMVGTMASWNSCAVRRPGQVDQQHVARCPLDQGADRRAVVAAHDQVSFPVPGHGPVLGLGAGVRWIEIVPTSFPRRSSAASGSGACGAPLGTQMGRQFTFQSAAGLDEQGLVDRLRTHPHLRVIGMVHTNLCAISCGDHYAFSPATT